MNIISLLNRLPGNSAHKGYFLYKNIPSHFLQSLERDNFAKTVQYVSRNSPFYQRKFKEAGIDPASVKNPGDLGDFFTTAEDIRQNPEEFICARPDTAFETTGTTSKKTKRVYFSRSEINDAGWAGAVGLWGIGVRPADRVVSAFDYSFWVSGPVLQASCQVLGCFHIEAGRMLPDEFYDRVSDYKANVIVGDPSWLIKLSEIAQKQGAWPVKILIGGGENLTEDARRYIEDVWKGKFILSYGQTEAFGAIGMESLDQKGYHVNEFHNFFEIINTDTDGYGELVYSTINRRVMPLIRYRSGDITRFLEGPSPSGLPGKRIAKLRGRIDEWTPTAIGNIAPWMFESVFSQIKEMSDQWQIRLSKKGPKDLIEFKLEPNSTADAESLRENFIKVFQKDWPEAWRMANDMQLCHIEVSAVTPGNLKRGRKLRRIVDERVF